MAMLSDQAYRQIRQMIIDGQIAPSSRISEPELSARMELGTAAVRAALVRLAQDGLLRAIPRKGYVITPLTIEGARELMDIRIALEPRAAYLAAGHVRKEDAQAMRKHFARGYDIADKESMRTMISWNSEFRKMIARASGNARLATMIGNLVDEMERYLRLSWVSENRSESLLSGFDELMAALLAGDADAAREICGSQMAKTAANVLGSLVSRPEIQGARLSDNAGHTPLRAC